MHILFLTDNFPPEVNAPASRTFEHCREWVRAGHRVTVVTCAPNFPKGVVFDGYRNRPWQVEIMDGIHVVRLWTYITANEGFLKRSLDYVSFMVSAIAAAPFVRGIDIIVGTSPQFFTVCAANLISRLKGVPYVFELRDLWPESIRAVGAMNNSALLNLLEKVEMRLYRRAAMIVSVTDTFQQRLVKRGIDTSKIVVVTNGVDSDRFSPRSKDDALTIKHGLREKFVLGYIGTHGLAHGLETILGAAEHLRDSNVGKDVHFLFLGDGARKGALKERACALLLDNVTFLDSVPKSDVVRYWSILDASIIHLKDNDLFRAVIPSKLFESMGMGIPVLHGVAGESAEIVEREGVGVLFEPENVMDLVKLIYRLRDDTDLQHRLAQNGPIAAKKYDRKVLADRMLALLQRVTAV